MITFSDFMKENADKCPACGSAEISGSAETGIACDRCGFEE